MAEYTVQVNATSNSSVTTDDAFILIKATSTVTPKLKRVRVSFPGTTPADNMAQISVIRVSATGAGTTAAFTALKRMQNSPAASSTTNTKSGTNTFAVGTTADAAGAIIKTAVNTRSVFEWIARDEYDYIECALSNMIVVACQSGAASVLMNVECDFEE